MRQRFANISICCLQFLWITVENYHKVYGPAHEAHECRVMRSLLCKPDGGSRSRLALAMADRGAPSRDFSQSKELTALASLVPLLDGQWLTIGIKYYSVGTAFRLGGTAERSHDCVRFVRLDEANGSMCEEPPHGHASEKSVKRWPSEIVGFLTRLRDKYGLTATHLVLGQGLTTFERSTAKHLAGAGFNDIDVFSSHTTHASKVHEVGVEAAMNVHRNEEGNLVMDGETFPGTQPTDAWQLPL